ncbi:MAG: C40 family peptidase [Actinomycetes bacterium]
MRLQSGLQRQQTSVLISVLLASSFISLPSANASPNLASVRTQVQQLQQEATNIAEGAQQAQVQLNQLTRTLAQVQSQSNQEATSVSKYKKSLGAIAAEEYKSGALSQSMQLLFSSNPTLYLSSAGSLEALTKRKTLQLRQFSVAKQRLQATSLTVNAKLELVRAVKARYVAQAAAAQAKLAQAQKLLNQLSSSQRAKLISLTNARENADHAASLALAAHANLGSGRGAIALRYSIKQMGDIYVFGAAGPTYWDCSGLTMRAFGAAGVSLPHSAAYQYGYGRYIPRSQLRAGDLVFFGRPIDHVGIYIGGGKMVDAPHTGARVKIESFGSYFGNLPYVGAKRI